MPTICAKSNELYPLLLRDHSQSTSPPLPLRKGVKSFVEGSQDFQAKQQGESSCGQQRIKGGNYLVNCIVTQS